VSIQTPKIAHAKCFMCEQLIKNPTKQSWQNPRSKFDLAAQIVYFVAPNQDRKNIFEYSNGIFLHKVPFAKQAHTYQPAAFVTLKIKNSQST